MPSDQQTADPAAHRIEALREAAEICREFARCVREETGPSGDEPEYDAAMSCVNLILSRAKRLAERSRNV
ncbi:MAG: hypothetical protein JWP29_1995 [Rhodoferax sp.]|nr:hypothetical protein [Rhodoferax sp.]